MSTALGVAATAAVLQQMLETGLAELKIGDVLGGTGSPSVTCIGPDRVDADAGSDQLNLFLYNQTRNPGWANVDLPSRDSRGERVTNPALALDLHYLVTAYGSADFHAEVLLGAAMQILHDIPAMGRDAIREALKPSPNKSNIPKSFELAGLADQLEQLRITPLNHTTDEVSRIWSAIQIPARPSAAYQVSVVLMESRRSRRTPLPVAARNLYAVPLRTPRIDRVESANGAAAPIVPTSTLSLTGADLKSPGMMLLVNGIDVSAGVTRADNELVEFSLLLPDPPNPSTLPAGLRAGICTVQVVYSQLMGTPSVPHRGMESNLGAFILNPDVVFTVSPGAVSTVVDGVTLRSGAISTSVIPKLDKRQRVRLMLNEKNPPASRAARAYSFDAPDGNGVVPPADQTDAVTIEYRNVVQGSYLARLQVDAGISPLTLGANGNLSDPEVAL